MARPRSRYASCASSRAPTAISLRRSTTRRRLRHGASELRHAPPPQRPPPPYATAGDRDRDRDCGGASARGGMSHPTDRDHRVVVMRGGRFGKFVVSLVVVAGRVFEQPAAAPVPRAETARAARRPTRPASAPNKADSNRSREAARLGSGVSRSTHSTVERAELHIIIGHWSGVWGFGHVGPPGSGEEPLSPCPAGPPLFRPQHRTGGKLNPTWSELRKLEPTCGVNLRKLESTYLESRSKPGVKALKTWSELTPTGASSLQLERAHSNWSWSEVAPTGASSLRVGAKSERVERATEV